MSKGYTVAQRKIMRDIQSLRKQDRRLQQRMHSILLQHHEILMFINARLADLAATQKKPKYQRGRK